jgi:hypothetical protein
MGDARLTARLLQMTGMFYDKPTANIPQACGSAMAAKAAYRFLDNENVQWPAILASHYAATEARVREAPLVLVAQDTTTLNYSTHPHTDGLGPIGTDSEQVRGLMVHDTLAFTPEGTPLGLLDLQCWARTGIGSRHERHSKPIEDKESFKWVQSYQVVSAVQKRCRNTVLVMMADREADIHEVFAAQARTAHGAQLLIRAERSRNRQVLGEEDTHEPLWRVLEQQPVIGKRELLIPPNEKRAASGALAVRAAAVVLKPPARSLPTGTGTGAGGAGPGDRSAGWSGRLGMDAAHHRGGEAQGRGVPTSGLVCAPLGASRSITVSSRAVVASRRGNWRTATV